MILDTIPATFYAVPVTKYLRFFTKIPRCNLFHCYAATYTLFSHQTITDDVKNYIERYFRRVG